MHLVVDHEPPPEFAEQTEVRVACEQVGIGRGVRVGPGERLVGHERHRPQLLALPRPLARHRRP